MWSRGSLPPWRLAPWPSRGSGVAAPTHRWPPTSGSRSASLPEDGQPDSLGAMELEWAESEIRLLPGVYACGASSDGVVVFVDPYHDATATEQAALGVLGILGVTLPVRMVVGATGAAAALPSRSHVRVPAAAAMATAAAILVAGAASALATLTGGGGHHHIVAAPPPHSSVSPPVTTLAPVVTSPPPTTTPRTTSPSTAPPAPAAVVAPPPEPLVASAVPTSVRRARPVHA